MAVQGIFPPKFAPSSHEMGVLSATWKEFKEELNLYFLASGQGDIDGKRKVSILLYQLGKQCQKVFENDFMFANADEKKDMPTVLKKFDDYFEPKKLVKAYITKFQKRVQLGNESISTYITELRQLAKLCDFDTREENMLCVQISNGVRNEQLRKKLWDEDLTLKQIIQKCQTFELRNESSELFKATGSKDVNAVMSRGGRGSHRFDRGNRGRGRGMHRSRGASRSRGCGYNRTVDSGQNGQSISCTKCGTVHGPRQCPAYGRNCNFCNELGHYAKFCYKKKQVHSVEFDGTFTPVYDYEPVAEALQSLSIYVVSESNGSTVNRTRTDVQWSILLRTPYENGRGAVQMKIDTQAQCNILSDKSYSNMAKHANLKLYPTQSTITAFGNSVVTPIGKTNFEVILKGERFTIECVVVEGRVPNLLGAQDSERLHS
jgi:hypothetical protein